MPRVIQFSIQGFHISRLVFFVTVILNISACSFVEKFGDTVLKTAGFEPAPEVVESSFGALDIFDDPSPEAEHYLGRAVAAAILSRYTISSDSRLQAYLQSVGTVVSEASNLPETFGGYHFVVVNSEEVNAISAPGGFIFVSSGMLRRLKSEEELAAVLAHEVGHVILRHGVKSIERAKLNEALAQFGQLAGSLDCSHVLEQAQAIFGVAVNQVVTTLLERGYSRKQELQADQMASEIIMNSKYSPSSIAEMLASVGSSEGGGWYSTHPSTQDRLEELSKLEKLKFANSGSSMEGARTKRFMKLVKEKV